MDIVIENLNKKYNNKPILDNLNIKFKENAISFILGASGIGKTTLIRILMNLEKADGGNIKGINDKRISAVFQDDCLCENLSVRLNIKLVCENISDLKIEKALEQLDLKGCMNKKVRELSGGMKRRIAILRALLYDFDLLIMDEPFKGLDKETKEKVMNFVISKVKNKTVIIITHEVCEVEYFRENSMLRIDELFMG
ncbi:ATP-binding cassette domain-containing protein [Clostridium tarantellae]|uniref:ATP-binding cassette domain-containing protein n=1 Tax=Clostridium tarantellae TaxID=39493 RepID=A0A6I1MJR8_9CLOT|nr:ATP-binding cassette domain-containing protein [Clostridium tarantellae]MPQ42953.1 ATP-binding cassette domain-containing protein [Clostridium tarantellae]